MEMKRCPNGHLYNSDKYSEAECPSCMVEKYFAEKAALEGITLAEYIERIHSRQKDNYPLNHEGEPRMLYAGPPPVKQKKRLVPKSKKAVSKRRRDIGLGK